MCACMVLLVLHVLTCSATVCCNRLQALWKWASTNMRHNDPSDPRFGYFAWHCSPDTGKWLDPNPASDGETYFATALYMAAARFQDASYAEAANIILEVATNKTTPTNRGGVSNMFVNDTGVAGAEQQVVFVPYGQSASFTDPSYHLPAFYQYWSTQYQPTANSGGSSYGAAFWEQTVNASRAFFKLGAATSKPGLMADYSTFAGAPTGSGINHMFAFDAWRVAQNVAMDYAWYRSDPWQVQYCNALLQFFAAQNASKPYGNQYNLPAGTPASGDHSPGLVSMNAVCSLASSQTVAWSFVRELWDTHTPTGKYRYYDGMLFMLGWLHVSGTAFALQLPAQPICKFALMMLVIGCALLPARQTLLFDPPCAM